MRLTFALSQNNRVTPRGQIKMALDVFSPINDNSRSKNFLFGYFEENDLQAGFASVPR